MNRSQYERLLDLQFLSKDGSIQFYSSEPPYAANFQEIEDIILGQLKDEIDLKNVVIMFPVGTGYGRTGIYGPERIVIDHCTNFLNLRPLLHKKGIRFKDDIEMTSEKYSMMNVAMLIIQDGVAYAIDSYANPYGTNLTYNRAASYNSDPAVNHAEIKYDDKDKRNGVGVKNKPVYFSGFVLHSFKHDLDRINKPKEKSVLTEDAQSRMDKYNAKENKIRDIAATIFNMRFKDESAIDNHALDTFFEQYASLQMPKFHEWFEKLWALQKEEEQSYGDIDHSCKKVFDGTVTEPDRKFDMSFMGGKKDGVLKGKKKEVKVLLIDDHSSCADITKFLVFQEREENRTFGKNDEIIKGWDYTYHVRIVWDDDVTDYKKGVQHVSCPNLKWYEDRGWTLDYIEKYHMGPLGGSYADCRDDGYVLTAKLETRFGDKRWKVEKGVRHRFHQFEFVCRNINGALYELKEEADGN